MPHPSQMTDTPQTDLAEQNLFNGFDFARTLERDIAAANTRVAELEAERDRLRKSLERLVQFTERVAFHQTGDCGCAALAQDGRRCYIHTETHTARAALAAQEAKS
jgi:precorrin-3B methylase